MCGQYWGIEKPPIPERPTKDQALNALSALRGQIRYEYILYYHEIVKRFIDNCEQKDKE